MITDLTTYISYFSGLATSHITLVDMVYGGSSRILNRELSTADYPLLWLEVPDATIEMTNDDWFLNFRGAFLCLAQAAEDDWATEDTNMNSMLLVVKDILTKLYEDAEDGLFEFDIQQAVILPKPKLSADNDHGWRVEVDIRVPISNCVNEANWA